MTKSQYADRDTVGTIALTARSEGEKGVCAGDMGHEMMKGLVDDINETIASNLHRQNEFYISVHEKKDSQLGNCLLRRMCVSDFRPYPETCTSVFKVNPKTAEVWHCWTLPHWSHFENIMANKDHYAYEMICDIAAYVVEDNERFGFLGKGKNVIPIPGFKDREMKAKTSDLIAS